MTIASNSTNSLIIKKTSYGTIVLWGLVFFFLLLLRDSYSVGINKYIFLGITCVCALYMKTSDLIYLFYIVKLLGYNNFSNLPLMTFTILRSISQVF